MNSPVSITVPSRITLSHLHSRHLTVPVQVADTGSKPLHITVSDGAYTQLAEQHNATSWVTSMTPASFTLQPGKTQTVSVSMTVPAAAHGQSATQVVFSAQAPGDPTGNVSVTGAVATSLVVSLPGHTTTAHAPPLVTGPPPGTFPAMPVAAGGTAVLLAALGAVLVTRARRRGARHARTARHAS